MKQGLICAVVFCLAAVPTWVAAQGSYTIQPGDTLEISVWKEPDLQRTVLVTPDGAFSFPLVGVVSARGQTINDLQKLISFALAQYIAEPVVTVSIEEIKGNKVYVIGQVNRPGEFVANPMVDVMQALSMAGGMTPFADVDNIRILRRVNGAQQAMQFNYSEVAKGRRMEQNVSLLSGDLVVVP